MLVTYLRDNWTLFFGRECPAEFQIAVVSSCTDDYGNDLVLIFADSAKHPTHVMKITRSSSFGFKVEREHAALEQVVRDDRLRAGDSRFRDNWWIVATIAFLSIVIALGYLAR